MKSTGILYFTQVFLVQHLLFTIYTVRPHVFSVFLEKSHYLNTLGMEWLNCFQNQFSVLNVILENKLSLFHSA